MGALSMPAGVEEGSLEEGLCDPLGIGKGRSEQVSAIELGHKTAELVWEGASGEVKANS